MRINDLPKGQALYIKVGAHQPDVVDIDWPSKDYFQKMLNGYVEHLSFTNGGEPFLAVFDENAKESTHEYNELASHIVNTHLVGDVVLINPSDL